MIRFLFWRLFPAPQVGDRFVYESDKDNPWLDYVYRVTERKGNWYRLRLNEGSYYSKERWELIAFYRKI